jgi:hypothetical protein
LASGAGVSVAVAVQVAGSVGTGTICDAGCWSWLSATSDVASTVATLSPKAGEPGVALDPASRPPPAICSLPFIDPNVSVSAADV